MPSIDNLCFIKKQLELMKYSVECDTKQKSLTMIKYHLSLAIQAAKCNREIINALCNWKEVLMNEYNNNNTKMILQAIDTMLNWINVLITEKEITNN
jgi:hypothetical protein